MGKRRTEQTRMRSPRPEVCKRKKALLVHRQKVPCPDPVPDMIRWAREHSQYKHLPPTGEWHILVPRVEEKGKRVSWSLRSLDLQRLSSKQRQTRAWTRVVDLLERHQVKLDCFVTGACRAGDDKSNDHGVHIIFNDHEEAWPEVRMRHPHLAAEIYAEIKQQEANNGGYFNSDSAYYQGDTGPVRRLLEVEFARQSAAVASAARALWKDMADAGLSPLSFRRLLNAR